jgi:hypothetical protein
MEYSQGNVSIDTNSIENKNVRFYEKPIIVKNKFEQRRHTLDQ